MPLFRNLRGLFASRFSANKEAPQKHPPEGYVAGGALADLRVEEPKDQADLAEKMRSDCMVQFAEFVLKANLKTAMVTVTCEGGDQRAVALADQLQQLWFDALPSMCQAIGDGRVAYEKVWGYDPTNNLNVIERLEPLPFRQTEMELDPDGEFNGLVLKVGENGLPLSPHKCWWLALDPTVLEPHGKSRYAGAPLEVWKQRQHTFNLRSKYLRRFALRGGVIHMPPTIRNEQTGQIEDNFKNMAAAIESYYVGGVMMFPNTPGPGKEGFDHQWTEPPTAMDPSPLEMVLEGQDTEQLRSFGIPEKTVIEGEAVGSHAMVSIQMLTLLAVVEDLLGQFCNSFKKQVIENAVQVNYRGMTAPVFAISFPQLKDKIQKSQEQPMIDPNAPVDPNAPPASKTPADHIRERVQAKFAGQENGIPQNS